jgi:hypothetical protein
VQLYLSAGEVRGIFNANFNTDERVALKKRKKKITPLLSGRRKSGRAEDMERREGERRDEARYEKRFSISSIENRAGIFGENFPRAKRRSLVNLVTVCSCDKLK